MTTTGAYSAVPAADISQMKETAPVTDACLLNRFQLACAMAAMRMRAMAVGFSGRLLPVMALAGTASRALEVSVP